MFIPIGGIEQWVQIGTENRDNPVLLYLHGGPGGSSRPAAGAWKPWERHFTVVHWDQRGAGRTFERNGEVGSGRLTVDRMVRDGIGRRSSSEPIWVKIRSFWSDIPGARSSACT